MDPVNLIFLSRDPFFWQFSDFDARDVSSSNRESRKRYLFKVMPGDPAKTDEHDHPKVTAGREKAISMDHNK